MLHVKHLSVNYGNVSALSDISFDIAKHQTVVIVGESGSGKSTVLGAIMGLLAENASVNGSVFFKDQNLLKVDEKILKAIRGAQIGWVFQNASLSLDSLKTIAQLMTETVRVHETGKKTAKKQILEAAAQMMDLLGLEDTRRILDSYPFELSGGMCQRVAIAAAVINHPMLLLADEPTSALDVTAQIQVIKMLEQLKQSFKMSMLIVTHSMGIAARLADQIMVMKGGRIVETGTAGQVLQNPRHDYTRALIKAVPKNLNLKNSDIIKSPDIIENQRKMKG